MYALEIWFCDDSCRKTGVTSALRMSNNTTLVHGALAPLCLPCLLEGLLRRNDPTLSKITAQWEPDNTMIIAAKTVQWKFSGDADSQLITAPAVRYALTGHRILLTGPQELLPTVKNVLAQHNKQLVIKAFPYPAPIIG